MPMMRGLIQQITRMATDTEHDAVVCSSIPDTAKLLRQRLPPTVRVHHLRAGTSIPDTAGTHVYLADPFGDRPVGCDALTLFTW